VANSAYESTMSLASVKVRRATGPGWADENNKAYSSDSCCAVFPSPPVLGGRGAGVRGVSIPRENMTVQHRSLSPLTPPSPPEYRGEGADCASIRSDGQK